MNEPLPILISIPHGGNKIPKELLDRISIQQKDIFDDGDAYTIDIYDLGARVLKTVKTDIARAFIDLNRASDDRHPQNPDGVVKSFTCFGQPIYRNDRVPDDTLIGHLLAKYYFPYHHTITNAFSNTKFEFALDCHSMAAVGPPISPDVGHKRPMICLGNLNGKTCPAPLIEKLADCYRMAFSLNRADVVINKPFAGGYITQKYGGKPVPWIQVEMNRKLYLAEPWFNNENLKVSQKRLQELNLMFANTLLQFFNR